MENNAAWGPETDNLLKYLYEEIKIYNWATIADELSSRFNQNFSRDGCRNRYLLIGKLDFQVEWSPEEQQELYRLHNQNGNKWAIIAYNLLGRTDNSVKNHFYSKLRKSLRTLNKIGKNYLKKSVKEVSNTVLYKLTEATDQALKQHPEISQEMINLCYDLKARLLNYDMDQKDIKEGFDYSFERNLLADLTAFSRNYRKKPKKEKNSAMGTQNLKKLHERKRREKQLKLLSINMYQREEEFSPDEEEDYYNHLRHESNRNSESSSIYPKIARTVVLKAPSLQDQIKIEESSVKIQEIDSPRIPNTLNLGKPQNEPSLNPNKNEVQNVLRNIGVLQSQNQDENDVFRKCRSRSFSVHSGSSGSIKSSCSDFDPFNDPGDHFKDLDSVSQNYLFDHHNSNFQN